MKATPRYKSLNFKFYMAMAVMLLLSAAGSLYIFQSSAKHFRKLIRVEFKTTTQSLENVFSLLSRNTTLASINIAVDRELSQQLTKVKKKTIQARIKELRQVNGVDIVVLFNHAGKVVAHSSKYTLSNSDIEKLADVYADRSSLPTESLFVPLEKQLIYCHTSVLSSVSPKESYLVLAGLTVDSTLLRLIQNNSHIDISVLLNSKIQTSTRENFSDAVIPVLSPDELSGDAFLDQLTIEQNIYYAKFEDLSPNSSTAEHTFLLTHSIKDISRLNRKILVNLTTFLGLQTILICLLGLFFVKNFLSPIRNLTETIAKVTRGQFNSHVTITGDSELQSLASHFNKMTDFIRDKDEDLETLVMQRTNSLEEQNIFIDNILNSATDLGIVASDSKGKITYANPTAEQLFAYKATDIIGQPIENVHCNAEISPEIINRGMRDIPKNDRFFYTIEQIHDGLTRQVECTITEMIATDEQFTGYLLLARDVTREVEMDLYLSTAIAELDIIFENSSLAIVYEHQGRIARVNRAFETMFRFERQEVLGQQWHDFFSTLQSGKTDSFWDKITEAHFVQNKAGEEFWISINKRSTDPDNPAAGAIWTFEDISKQKEAELKIKQLSMAVEQSHNSVVITDTSGTIQYVNSAFIHLTGYTFAEAIGQNPSILKSGKTPDAVFKQMWETITSGDEWSGQFINKKKNGDLYEEHVTIAPIRNENDEIINYIATKENITQLKEAHRQADLANKTKSEFLANMSHEIRTPMNLVFGMTELLLDTELQVEQKKFLNHIQSAANNLLGLINDILDYSKIESGKLSFEQKVMVLEELFDDLEGALALAAEQKGIDLHFVIENESDCYPIGDRLRLHQVLMNLIGNAIKFTEEGKVEAEVVVRDTGENQCTVQFMVKDTGIGIEAEKQKHIFDSFSQANTSITRKYGGTGLGLAISSKLIDLMGGKIELSSAPGLGTIFSFSLIFPKGERVKAVEKSEEISCAPDIPLTILLVEDSKANQELAKLILQKDKHHVTISENGLDALRLLCEKQFDVILMDVQMPVMDGLTATSIIRKFETDAIDPLPEYPELREQLHLALSGKHIPIIAMTANAMTGDREKCLAAGTDNYLTKPYSTVQLRAALAGAQNSLDASRDVFPAPSAEKSATNDSMPVSREKAREYLQENFNVDDSELEGILDTFAQSMQTAMTALSQALNEKDMRDVAAHAHQLKGVLHNLGLTRQARLTTEIESHTRVNQVQDCQIVMTKLRNDLREFL